jgi:transposase
MQADANYYKKRWQIIFYCIDSYGPKFSASEAAKKLKISRGMVDYWINIYKKTGSVNDASVPGRPRTTTKQDEKVIDASLSSGKPISTIKIRASLTKKGSNVSLRTIQRRLRERKVTYGPELVKPLINPEAIKKRLNFAKENLERDWSNVVFTDEVTFSTYTYKKHVWRLPNEKHVIRSVKHPAKLHAWGCFCSKGFGRLFLFTKTLDAQMMVEIYKKALIPSAQLWFKDNSDWILQEDNDPKHKSKLAKDWKNQELIQTLDWPSYSPDLNPIENVWGLLKARLQANPVYNLNSLVVRLQAEWKSLCVPYAQKLAQSCSRRVEGVIEAKGDYTIY